MSRLATIRTEYVGPTDTRGSRIVASRIGSRARVSISYDYALNPSDLHERAARQLAEAEGFPVLVGSEFGLSDGSLFTFTVGE